MYTEEITNIIKEINPYIDINQDTELIDSGILDSLSIVFLITQIEDRFGVYVDEKLVVPENFKTLEKICEILGKCVKRE
jgi:acyl carrier protein